MRAEEISELLPFMTAEERAELNRLLATDKALWRPLPGPQSDAYNSDADIIGYGGAAGGGKTDLACGKAITQHKRVMILRREATQLSAIIDRLTDLLGTRDGFNGQEKIWRLGKRQIEFGSVPNAGDETKYQGRPHDLLVFDEAANFLEGQVRFLLGWLRTTDPKQKCQALLTFNPPTSAEGRWLISYFAPWLDDKHHNPAKPGELRWFATVDGKDISVEHGAEFVLRDGMPIYDFDRRKWRAEEIVKPLSRTFIPSRVSDNPYLMGTGYLATLQSLPEPLRSQMLKGDFLAGMEDDIWQIIPTMWVDAAMARWLSYESMKPAPMDSMGVDVARGGADQTIISRRHGTWFDKLIVYPGVATPDGPTVMAHILAARRDRAPVHVDVIGVGSSPTDFLRQNDVQTIAVSVSNGSNERSADGVFAFRNQRAELWWRMREALDPMSKHPISLPPDNGLRADLCAPRWKPGAAGILVESKDDIRARIQRSPDRADAVVMALMATPKLEARLDRYSRSKGRSSVGGGWA